MWTLDKLNHRDRVVANVRSSVLNGCRDVLRRKSRKIPAMLLEPDAPSAEGAWPGRETRSPRR
jgi:hypothetical protein